MIWATKSVGQWRSGTCALQRNECWPRWKEHPCAQTIRVPRCYSADMKCRTAQRMVTPSKDRGSSSRSRWSLSRTNVRAERVKLQATEPDGLADAWAMIEDLWRGTIARASELPEPVLHERVDGAWSFVQTHRHLVLVTDCWLRRMVKGITYPYHPWGLAGPWLTNPRRWGIEPDADPSLDKLLDLRWERMDEVRDVIASTAADELERNCVPPDSPGHPRKDHTVLQCLRVLLKEEWQHHRYAVRDLELLETRSSLIAHRD